MRCSHACTQAHILWSIFRYTIYLVDMNHEGLWETRGTLSYYADLISDLLLLSVELIHYVHMLVSDVIIACL